MRLEIEETLMRNVRQFSLSKSYYYQTQKSGNLEGTSTKVPPVGARGSVSLLPPAQAIRLLVRENFLFGTTIISALLFDTPAEIFDTSALHRSRV